MPRIVPVILSGGGGSRLWPLSRPDQPKQFLRLTGGLSMLQQTALRLQDPNVFDPPIVIGNAAHRFLIAEQLREIGIENAQVVLEPMARNTAAAVAVASLLSGAQRPGTLVLIAPADQIMRDPVPFLQATSKASLAGIDEYVVLFGIEPTSPATGFGYIELGHVISPAADLRAVKSFREKPGLDIAQAYVATGGYAWNAGIFLSSAERLRAEIAAYAPEVMAAAQAALSAAQRDSDFIRLDETAFERSPAISFDHAVMEHTRRAAVIPIHPQWSDVGSWSALWELGPQDSVGNVVMGDVMVENSSASYLRAEGTTLAVIGLEGVVVVATPQAVLVTARNEDQQVRKIADRLSAPAELGDQR